MSKYTTQLGNLIEGGFDLGLQDYPLYIFKNYQGDYRKQLNDKLKEHYYFREIGLETPALFKRFLNRKMNEIMPYYNQLYESADLEFNPLWNIDLTETYTHNVADTGNISSDGSTSTNSHNSNTGSVTQNSTVDEDSSQDTTTEDDNTHNDSNTLSENKSNSNIQRHSDFPQAGSTDADIMSNTYLSTTDYNTNTDLNSSTNTGTSSDKTTGTANIKNTKNSTTKNTEDSDSSGSASTSSDSNNKTDTTNNRVETYTRKEEGSTAGFHAPIGIKQWRAIMINIDMMIIEELEELFMQVW
jgi:hypothetical protein